MQVALSSAETQADDSYVLNGMSFYGANLSSFGPGVSSWVSADGQAILLVAGTRGACDAVLVVASEEDPPPVAVDQFLDGAARVGHGSADGLVSFGHLPAPART